MKENIEATWKVLLSCIPVLLGVFVISILMGDVSAQEKKATMGNPIFPVMSFPAATDSVLINVEGVEYIVKQNGWLFVGLVKLHHEWQRYNRECYNDSSLIIDQVFVPTDSLGNGVYNGYNTSIKRWIHREARWEDFMLRIGMIIDSYRVRK